jgi:uncharacterized protein YbjT (DUF2867 family)
MRTALVVGASGLVGSALVRMLLKSIHYNQVHILVRKELHRTNKKLVQHVVDFDQLATLPFDFKVDDAFCTLGTTIAKAGSQDAFIRVDHDYVIAFAEKALSMGAKGCYVVSSMGANPKSRIFYSRVKGQMEEKLKTLNFSGLAIFRPSLLLGPRTEKRAGEKFSGYMMKALDFMIPSKYKAIHVDKVAKKMVEVALKGEKGVHILDSGKLQ